MSAWEWSCSACPEVFEGDSADEAQAKFLTHAREVHNPKMIVSVNSDG